LISLFIFFCSLRNYLKPDYSINANKIPKKVSSVLTLTFFARFYPTFFWKEIFQRIKKEKISIQASQGCMFAILP